MRRSLATCLVARLLRRLPVLTDRCHPASLRLVHAWVRHLHRPTLTPLPFVSDAPPPADGWLQRKKTGGIDANRPDDKPRDGTETDNPADGAPPPARNGADTAAPNPTGTVTATQEAGSGAHEQPPARDVGDARNALSNGHGHATNGAVPAAPVPSPAPTQALPPPATINWTYRDPMGVVQGALHWGLLGILARLPNYAGPFSGQLMQEWHKGGFFPAELNMKRVDIDVEWRPLREWEAIGGKQCFLTNLNVNQQPPGLATTSAAPPPAPPVQRLATITQPAAQMGFSPQTSFASTADPYQGITQPSRASTLDATGTDSTSSSYNAAFGVSILICARNLRLCHLAT